MFAGLGSINFPNLLYIFDALAPTPRPTATPTTPRPSPLSKRQTFAASYKFTPKIFFIVILVLMCVSVGVYVVGKKYLGWFKPGATRFVRAFVFVFM